MASPGHFLSSPEETQSQPAVTGATSTGDGTSSPRHLPPPATQSQDSVMEDIQDEGQQETDEGKAVQSMPSQPTEDVDMGNTAGATTQEGQDTVGKDADAPNAGIEEETDGTLEGRIAKMRLKKKAEKAAQESLEEKVKKERMAGALEAYKKRQFMQFFEANPSPIKTQAKKSKANPTVKATAESSTAKATAGSSNAMEVDEPASTKVQAETQASEPLQAEDTAVKSYAEALQTSLGATEVATIPGAPTVDWSKIDDIGTRWCYTQVNGGKWLGSFAHRPAEQIDAGTRINIRGGRYGSPSLSLQFLINKAQNGKGVFTSEPGWVHQITFETQPGLELPYVNGEPTGEYAMDDYHLIRHHDVDPNKEESKWFLAEDWPQELTKFSPSASPKDIVCISLRMKLGNVDSPHAFLKRLNKKTSEDYVKAINAICESGDAKIKVVFRCPLGYERAWTNSLSYFQRAYDRRRPPLEPYFDPNDDREDVCTLDMPTINKFQNGLWRRVDREGTFRGYGKMEAKISNFSRPAEARVYCKLSTIRSSQKEQAEIANLTGKRLVRVHLVPTMRHGIKGHDDKSSLNLDQKIFRESFYAFVRVLKENGTRDVVTPPKEDSMVHIHFGDLVDTNRGERLTFTTEAWTGRVIHVSEDQLRSTNTSFCVFVQKPRRAARRDWFYDYVQRDHTLPIAQLDIDHNEEPASRTLAGLIRLFDESNTELEHLRSTLTYKPYRRENEKLTDLRAGPPSLCSDMTPEVLAQRIQFCDRLADHFIA